MEETFIFSSRVQGEDEKPRKRRKVDQGLNVAESQWIAFEQDVRTFEVQHVHGNGKFAFGFVEGPLVKALRSGHWILLDEVNLASPETLECISSLLHGPTASITLTEQGSLEPIPRHPEFRLFACMNPATDVGKKDLPPNIRSRFTEIDVPPPDADKETLLSIISKYIGHCAVGDMGAIMDVAEFYTSVRVLAERRELADGSNHRPHFSMRTLARALTFAADLAPTYSLRRSLWEGCLMAFTMSLDDSGAQVVTTLAQKYILAGVRNSRSLLSKEPSLPSARHPNEFVKFGPIYLERGPLAEDSMDEYIMTPSVEKKLVDLARILVTRRFPVLIEGPTSAGKTSSIEYLARRTGHRFVRINNHEHTDIQEYLGTYVSDPNTGKLVFKDGLLVRALRSGDWIVLDELNLAPTDVLEALNRLLDDNRELVIPETQEVVRPHPHFMLFATQNPPGLYAGRKILSRAFRNRFLEVHFQDVPQTELETILCQRCRIAPSYGQRIVAVFRELQKRRQTSRIFESKQGFATLRDLFRWAGRDALDYQELADNGYMLLAERARRDEDKQVVKEIIESIMKVRIDPTRLYNLRQPEAALESYLGCPLPRSSRLVWTSAMQRLFILTARALRFNEPVLLVGETGCGKTSVCQLYAEILSKALYAVNCHQNTETADLIGGMRPMRNRSSMQTAILHEASALLESLGHSTDSVTDAETMLGLIDRALKNQTSDKEVQHLSKIRDELRASLALFEWHDGPLVEAMRQGDVFLMDEISLADDSVLERLNSVLEPSRTIVLAERGGNDHDALTVQAVESFKLVATMNPGGDYGKKELSPALRNRFTEIWVPPVDSRADLELIVDSLWRHEALRVYTAPLLDFTQWLSNAVSDRTLVGLRDILAWVEFSNAVYSADETEVLPLPAIFHHAARMTLLDGLGSLPQLSSYTPTALDKLQKSASTKLHELVPLPSNYTDEVAVSNPVEYVQLGSFSIARGPASATPSLFSFDAPTTRDNVMRVVRGCQLPKPILLEGSPGVGKTSLIAALANVCGYDLCRINLSDQTDLVDLFGSDLPVEGGAPGEFAWKDAEFLRALQEGRWVLLDEMNLAPQAVLEGLNAVLDHRGTVYIPELGRSFTRHPSFRIFAAQNPLHQGGGRKGLPKSFLNRFTKVYVQELSKQDVLLVCRNLFPALPVDILHGMIDYTIRLNEEVMVKRTFGRVGAPWEFNLRDVIRWGSLLEKVGGPTAHPSEFFSTLFLQRFRVLEDRRMANQLFHSVFVPEDRSIEDAPSIIITPNLLRAGRFNVTRSGFAIGRRTGLLLQVQLPALESMAACVTNEWLTILTGPKRSGKSSLVRLLAQLAGRTLREIPINNATDATDILGSFEEVDTRGRSMQSLDRITDLLGAVNASGLGSQLSIAQELAASILDLSRNWSETLYANVKRDSRLLLDSLAGCVLDETLRKNLSDALTQLSSSNNGAGRFEWVDGPLVRALRYGFWVCLDGANLCNPSVLDRLNSLCEKDGSLLLNERGAVNGEVETIKPHPNFRLFMCVDNHYGELSRAMRNRGVEVALTPADSLEDRRRLLHYFRLPVACAQSAWEDRRLHLHLETVRRGIHTLDRHASGSVVSPSGLLLTEDSSSSSLLELVQSLKTSCASTQNGEAMAHFTTSVISPTRLPLLVHFVRSHSQEVGGPLSFVPLMTQSHAFSVTRAFRELCSSSQDGAELLLAQPMDLQMTHLGSKLASDLAQALPSIALLWRLYVTLATTPDLPQVDHYINSTANQTQMSVQERTTSAVVRLCSAINTVASRICDNATLTDHQIRELLTLSLHLMSCARYLAKISGNAVLDYSAVLVAVNMLSAYFSDTQEAFDEVEIYVRELAGLVSPSTGLGLSDIWTTLSPLPVDPRDKLADVERLALTLPLDRRALRTQIFQLLALLKLPAACSPEHEKGIDTLFAQIGDLQNADAVIPKPEENPLLLINELHYLSKIAANVSGMDLVTLQDIISSACLDPSSSLSRLVPYQHLMWELQAAQPIHSTLAQAQRLWLEGLWNLPMHSEVYGPAVLLMPVALQSTARVCNCAEKTLLQIDVHEEALRRHLSSVLNMSAIGSKRIVDLENLGLQCLLLIVFCFRDSYTASNYAEIEALSSKLGDESVLPQLLFYLEQSRHPGLNAALHRHFMPLVQRLTTRGSAVQGSQALVGELWIVYARVVLDLFVPNIPIDPALLQRRALEFRQQESTIIQAQIDMHEDLERRTTGRTTNGTVRFLQSMLPDPTQSTVAVNGPLSRRADLGRLHTYWSEVQEFLNRVVSVARIQSLVADSNRGSSTIAQVEHVVQESISAFCQRLNGIYQDFYDINSPICTALFGLKLGLRLVVDAAVRGTRRQENQVADALLTFPTVKSAEDLRGVVISSVSNVSLNLLVARLAGVALEADLSGSVRRYIGDIEQLYEQAAGLWSIDLARADEKEREAQSLYRRKSDGAEMTEAEAEEEEFLSIFPEFEDVLSEDIVNGNKTTSQAKAMVQGSATLQLFRIHQGLFLKDVETPTTILERYAELCSSLLLELVQSHVTLWPEDFDRRSAALQMRLLHAKLAQLKGGVQMSDSYDFYHDANIPEVKKAAVVLKALCQRLDTLILQWPDQMVLQHLRSRCDIAVSFTIDSPVAKILSALEQLLLQLEDWEMYANRDNSLKDHRQAIIELIVMWRRMELSAWRGLLNNQARAFAEATSEWWFRLYDATVRGVVSTSKMDEDAGDRAGKVDKFLDDLIPLLDDFMSGGPLGQFSARLHLLHSMENFMDVLIDSEPSIGAPSLRRVKNLLSFTRCYYAQFEAKVAASLSDQRTVLDREVQDFIKLASWKDVNVQALRQSAQKTHRQLYKIIRKFRDILRQPLDGLLRSNTTSVASLKRDATLELNILESFPRSEGVASFPDASSSSPQHLINLPTTFRNFTAFINNRLLVYLESHLPHSVESFAEEIITTSKALAEVPVPSSADATRRLKLQKSLLTRKRKAWSDTLKELKRAGFSSNVKPEALERNRSQRWIREQPPLDGEMKKPALVDKAEEYFYRLCGILPQLRNCLLDHSSDISTRELQRAVMHIESIFALAMRSRSCLECSARELQEMTKVYRRMQQISSDPHVAAAGHSVVAYLSFVKAVPTGLVRALRELSELLLQLQSDDSTVVIPPSLMMEINGTITALEEPSATVDEVLQAASSSAYPVLLQSEYIIVESAMRQLSTTEKALERWCSAHPRLSAFIHPVLVWLQSKQAPTLEHAAYEESAITQDQAIDSVLLNIQAMLKVCPTADAKLEEEENDNYILDDCRLVCLLSERTNLQRVSRDLHGLIASLSTMSADDTRVCIARVSPFVDRYMSLAQAQMTSQGAWTKSLFKLGYILSAIVSSVAKDGFCQPREGEEAEGDGEGQESGDGVGMGEGTGTENVSREIQEESQVEGLQGEDTETNEKAERAEEGNAIEMSEDFGGEMQDVPQDEGEEDGQSEEEESEGEPDEQLGDLDGADENAVDEKLWGDEKGPDDRDKGGKTDKDHSKQNNGESETVAKEGEQARKDHEDQQAEQSPQEEEQEQTADESVDAAPEDDEVPGPDGAPLDEYTQEAETLDLPENMELDGPQSQQADGDIEDEDDLMEEQPEDENVPEPGSPDVPPDEGDEMDVDNSGMQRAVDEDALETNEAEDETNDDAVAQPDTHAGDGTVTEDARMGDSSAQTSLERGADNIPDEQRAGEAGAVPGEASQLVEDDSSQPEQTDGEDKSTQDKPAETNNAQSSSQGASGVQKGSSQAAPQESRPLSSNPLRSLGDALREISQRFSDILESETDGNRPNEKSTSETEKQEPAQLEYIREDDTQDDMQALGPAGEEREAKLRELNLMDETEPVSNQVGPPDDEAMDVDSVETDVRKSHLPGEETSEALQSGMDSALMPAEIRASQSGQPRDPLATLGEGTHSPDGDQDSETSVELALQQWQAEGQPSDHAEYIWRRYESLTHDLSYALCEQLRLILEPTMATRLKGDYRTGKRLNMKKIIPYIASEYTKDKIWLRRTRPSQREYQVLIALDDSKSMAESHSVHLAFQTLALVSKALSRLEVGDVAIAKFGQSVDVLHGFDGGPFTDQAGTKIMDAFKFNQQATQVHALLETSLVLLEQARERRAMSSSSAADLWQMEIIISDGICQDHERLRSILRKAEEQRVMVVFIILDSLHTNSSTSVRGQSAGQSSILSMNQVAYKEVDGRMDLTVTRYLDTFPFEYYVVVRDVEALPDVLANTLKQFFERISEE
ncbi:hypothetical protein NM688_g1823 [Phlebia brevispora]|uniref:Uncharacterized protein n=1 Tax=Phlebia brevispora TaxID=194682 RepID=A0ACC1TAM1_9APHY|nr:hypothetical protein NM688_g1823 [Phlebia brevispora]